MSLHFIVVLPANKSRTDSRLISIFWWVGYLCRDVWIIPLIMYVYCVILQFDSPGTAVIFIPLWNDYPLFLPVLSELQRIVSFSWAPGPCLIQTEMVNGSFRLVLTMPSGTLMAWVPLNSNTWSLSCPLSVGSPTVQLAELLGAGRSSTVPELAPEKQSMRTKAIGLGT